MGTTCLRSSDQYVPFVVAALETLVTQGKAHRNEYGKTGKGCNYLKRVRYRVQYSIGTHDQQYDLSFFCNPIQVSKKNPMKEMTFVFHLSQYNGIKDSIKQISRFIDRKLVLHIFKNWEIARLDLWIDLDEKFTNVFHQVYRPNVKTGKSYESNTVTVYVGKNPYKVRIYEKKLSNGNLGTRIELELTKNRCPIDRLVHFRRLRKFSAFKDLKRIAVNKDLLFNLAEKKNKRENAEEFYDRYRYFGFNHAKRHSSSQLNFSRDLSGIIKKSSSEKNFHNDWLKNLNENILAGF